MNAGRRRAHRERSDEQIAAKAALLHPDGTKFCKGCHQTKPLAAFAPDRNRPDGRRQGCRDCRTRGLAEREQDARLTLPAHVAWEALRAARD